MSATLPAPAAAPIPALPAAMLALVAIGAPALIVYNAPPSATFVNQAAAVIGWAALIAWVAPALRLHWLRSPGIAALLAALGVLAAAAATAPLLVGLPAPLASSSFVSILAAMLVLLAGVAFAAGGRGVDAFQALCLALCITGLLSSCIAALQVLAPEWLAESGLAASASQGRASGNLRQPNHLSSLLLWSMIAAVWLGEVRVAPRALAAGLVALFVFGIVLSASRTGTVGIAVLFAWGMLDRRLSRATRLLLMVSPLLYALFWLGLSAWAADGHAGQFAGQGRFNADGDLSSSRFAIWRDTLELIAAHPWLGVGFGEFNFAWSLTPFPKRPVAFFDHTHNLPLQLVVELGVPLGGTLVALLAFALWRALRTAHAAAGPDASALRAAVAMVLMMVVHSQFEYPLWYAYFLLPTVFALGLCLGRERPPAPPGAAPRWPLRAGAALMLALGVASVIDYHRVVAVFVSDDDRPLALRIADGQRSWFFAHHAHYAAVTVAEHPSQAMPSFAVATHYLLDTRLMMAWAQALHEAGDDERARHLAARLREFRNPDAQPFFLPCDAPRAGQPLPFQCTPPEGALDYRDFRRRP